MPKKGSRMNQPAARLSELRKQQANKVNVNTTLLPAQIACRNTGSCKPTGVRPVYAVINKNFGIRLVVSYIHKQSKLSYNPRL